MSLLHVSKARFDPAIESRMGQRMVRRGVTKYSEDQPRDEQGEWTTTGGSPAGITADENNLVSRWVQSYDTVHSIQSDPASPDAKLLNSVLQKCPPVNSTIYRGIHMGSADGGPAPIDQVQQFFSERIGQSLTFRGPVSTSPVQAVAAAYAEPAMFKITPQDGAARDITWKLNDLHSGEFKEAILAPGRYRVDSVSMEKVRDSFYNKGTRQAVVVSVTDVTKGDRSWLARPVTKVARVRHRMQAEASDLVFSDDPALK
jgi:hypothetical protein